MASTPINEKHIPVMLADCIEVLGAALSAPGAVLVDGTLGLGGHSEAFLEKFPQLHLVAIDRDSNALAQAGERLARFSDRTDLVQAIYSEIPEVLAELEIEFADAILLDLGVSSMQLDEVERGFAYSFDAPLDMRMDDSSDLTAARILNTYGEDELAIIFKSYGEERYAKQIAREIVKLRVTSPFVTSKQLTTLIQRVVPFIPGKSSGHPAKRIFQALRIEVNGELEILSETMPAALSALRIGGRIVVLAYQSLEDRIVKQYLQAAAVSSAPIGLPELPEHAPTLKLVVKGARLATDEEVSTNPRAASVRMRAAEKIRQAA